MPSTMHRPTKMQVQHIKFQPWQLLAKGRHCLGLTSILAHKNLSHFLPTDLFLNALSLLLSLSVYLSLSPLLPCLLDLNVRFRIEILWILIRTQVFFSPSSFDSSFFCICMSVLLCSFFVLTALNIWLLNNTYFSILLDFFPSVWTMST